MRREKPEKKKRKRSVWTGSRSKNNTAMVNHGCIISSISMVHNSTGILVQFSLDKNNAERVHEENEDFPINLHAHMLRHSVAMSMYKNGIPISYVKDFLGHSDLSTTSVYAYADNEDIRKALVSVQNDIPSSPVKEKKWKGKESELIKYCGLG